MTYFSIIFHNLNILVILAIILLLVGFLIVLAFFLILEGIILPFGYYYFIGKRAIYANISNNESI